MLANSWRKIPESNGMDMGECLSLGKKQKRAETAYETPSATYMGFRKVPLCYCH